MECQILCTLDFQISNPTAAHLLAPLLRANDCDESQQEFVKYICELALLDHRFFRLAPSRLVCAAILLSNELAGRVQSWPAVLQEHAGHSWEQLRPFVGELRLLLAEAPLLKFEAIRRKYQSAAHRHVASGWPKQ